MYQYLSFLILIIFANYLFFRKDKDQATNVKVMQGQLKRLWQDAYESIKSGKFARAERSLLALLKLDEKNVGAYNRLGILYSRQGMNKEAIDCFEISRSLEPGASSLNNLGLVYYEDGNYSKAARCFEEAIELDPKNPNRFIALAKTLEKMGDHKHAITQLEKAHRLEPGKTASQLLVAKYQKHNQEDLAKQVVKEAKSFARLAERAGKLATTK